MIIQDPCNKLCPPSGFWLVTEKKKKYIYICIVQFHIVFIFSILYISPGTSISVFDPNEGVSMILAYTHFLPLIFNFLEYA